MVISEVSSLDTVKILTGEEAVDAVKALNDESRRTILHALRARRMSSSELCEFLSAQEHGKEVKPQTVRYHLKELERAGLITQDGYAPAGNGHTHVMKKLWRATAENVFIATGDMDNLPDRTDDELDSTLDLVGIMRDLGFALDDEGLTKQLAEEFTERAHLAQQGRVDARKIMRQIPAIDPALYLTLRSILSIIRLNDADYKRYWELSKQVNDFLRKAYRDGLGRNPEVY
ncbi:MAG: winged helix-turn-helix domain-containing protein [Candidatus Thorarchaeota archaeon]